MAQIELTTWTLAMICEYISNHGPSRVLVDESGTAVPLGQAMEKYKITPSMIFIRQDGWSLGTIAELERQAEALWSDGWIAIMRRGNKNKWEIERYEFTKDDQLNRKEQT